MTRLNQRVFKYSYTSTSVRSNRRMSYVNNKDDATPVIYDSTAIFHGCYTKTSKPHPGGRLARAQKTLAGD